MITITSPEKIKIPSRPGKDIFGRPVDGQWPIPSIFLAGSIEQGVAEDWQTRVIKAKAAEEIVILNPRRETWLAEADEKFISAQIEWELDAMHAADGIIIYFQPGTLSPISLLEFGLWANSDVNKDLVVVCPEGFWRRTNVLVTAKRYNVPVYDTLEEGIDVLISHVTSPMRGWGSA